jgi:GT2 family glycosyltransferase
MIKIVCIIPSACTNKTLPYIKTCIRSLRTAEKGNVQLTILVVSANPQARALLVNEDIDNFYLVDPSLGFAQMNNIAIEESLALYTSDYYLLVNDDAYVQKNFFAVLTHIVSDAAPDIICPLVYKPDGSIDSFGIEYFTSGFAQNSQSVTTNTTLAPASCVLIQTRFLQKMHRSYGYFLNPLLHSYYEDTEFSLRTLAIGGRIRKEKTLIAHHIGSASYGKNSLPVMFYTFRNLLWVIGLTWPKRYVLKYLPVIILTQGWFIFCSIRDGGWWIYPKIMFETVKNISRLRQQRVSNLRAYTHSFSAVFSPFWFRTRQSGVPLG